jgi:hypothetical protein
MCLGRKRKENADHALHTLSQEVQEEAKEISKLRGALLANRAACHLQSKRWEACIQVSSRHACPRRKMGLFD